MALYQTAPAVSDYVTLNEIQHVLSRPDMYLNSAHRVQREAFCLVTDEKGKARVRTCLIFHPEAQEQIFLEVLGNAADNVWRSRDEFNLDPIRIEVTMNNTTVIVKNYGANIPVAQDELGQWVPYKIFNDMRTGSNFNDGKRRLYIGKNGFGSKLTNIFSLSFVVEAADPMRQLLFKGYWANNKSQFQCEILSYQGIGYTQVSFSPDFARFQAAEFDPESFQLYAARCAEVAYTCQIPVIFNGHEFKFKTIFDYADMFFPVSKANAISYSDPQGSYEICLVDTPGEAVCVSFVNGIITRLGGVHVDEAYKIIVAKIVGLLGKTAEGVTITKRDVVSHVSVFLNCRLNQPGFKGQAKEYLTKPTPKIDIPDDVMKNVKKWELVKQIYMAIEQKQKAKLKKTDGKKKKRSSNERITDANLAGGPRSQETTAILCEGDSAEAYVTVWISQVPGRQGRNFFGSLPLHGKLLNVLNADFTQMIENPDLKNIKEMLALEEDANYMVEAVRKRLRYGNVLIVTDPDKDGKHILGLVLLFFLCRFPGLVLSGMIKFLRVPVLRINDKGVKKVFFTYASYNEWRKTVPNPDDYAADYFKGLGTSEKKHVIEDFANPQVVTFQVDEQAVEKIVMAFHRTKSEERKTWLTNWFNRLMDANLEGISLLPISTFIDHELVEYSMEAVERNIPDGIGGIKESQQKALFAALKKLHSKKKDSKIKVAEIAHHAAEITNYKHGPNCLSDAIVMMSFDFCGSNNMPFFVARGMMGTRDKGGKDAAADRYTAISLPWWIDYIYRKEDNGLLKRVIDEGKPREIETYLPILPMHVINGASGVGTGWSTKIPNHNPLDIAFWFQQRISQDFQPNVQLPILRPWYKGFRGQIILKQKGFYTEGHFTCVGSKIVVDELPIGVWFRDYEKMLRKLEEEGQIDNYEDFSTDETPLFIIEGWKAGEPTAKKLGLITQHSYKNMTVLFKGPRGYYPKTYDDLTILLQDFYQIRLAKYAERKQYLLGEIQKAIIELSERLRFITAVNTEQLIIHRRSKKDVLADMARMNFDLSLYTDVKTSEYSIESMNEIPLEIQKKTAEYETLNAIPPGHLWYDELEQFIQAYCRHEGVNRSTFDSCNPTVTLTINLKL